MRNWLLIASAPALLASCGQPAARDTATATPAATTSNAAAPAPAAANDDGVAAIRAAEQDMMQGYATRDAKRVAAHYAADARLMSDGEAIVGHDAIATQLERYLALPKFTNTFTPQRVEASDDLGYARGHYRAEIVMRAGAAPQVGEGDYVTVYHRQPDGRWLITDDINTEKAK